MYLFRFAMLASVSLFFSAAMAQQAVPAKPVILTVTGLDPAMFPQGRAELDLTSLQALGESRITTSSIWTKGPHDFTGVMLRTLADHLKLNTPTLKLLALNDYAITFHLADATPDAPMLAYLMDGAEMSVRDKGPIWLIFPYDSDARFRNDQTFARSVWQLDRIEVVQ